jgi:hypothetical protein
VPLVLAHPDVEPVHRDRAHPHDRLARTRPWIGEVLDGEVLEASVSVENDGTHGAQFGRPRGVR